MLWTLPYYCHAVFDTNLPNNSAIHKAAGSLVTGRSLKTAGWNAPQRWFLPAAPIDSQWTLLCSTGIVPVEIMEQPGTVRPAAL